jgi:hypothetical protein
MRGTWVLRAGAILTLFSAAAWGGVIQDPAMGVEGGVFSDPIGTGVTFIPNGSGGGVFGFFNPFDSFITALDFQVQIRTGLSSSLIATAFTCNDQSTTSSPNPFFLNCSVNYDSLTGLLGISFFGVNPMTPDATPFDTEIGKQEGIPPLALPCRPPAPEDCSPRGHFAITLNNNFSVSPEASGGWSPQISPDLFDRTPTVTTTAVTLATPEPSTLLLGLPLLGLIVLRRRTKILG